MDLSNIDKNTLRSLHPLGGESLMESYITKINDSTNEDFKDILKMMDY
jgi:hypothetical protein